jgi:hypothetical protein
MLDLHATSGTPGAVATLANLTTICPNDLSPVAGVPIRDDARLILWGSASLIANTIAATKLTSQDLVDPINGETVSLGTASLKNLFYKFTNLPYRTGARIISQGTNSAQTATSLGATLDYYEGGSCIDGRGLRFKESNLLINQTLAVDVAVSWTTTGFAPATAIPNGKYALLGFYLSLSTGAHAIRFQHADFQNFLPGILTVDNMGSAILAAQEGMNDPLSGDPGYQFIALSELTGKPCVPVFRVSNAGTGLNIQSLATANTNTPVITPNLLKVG